MIVAHPDDETLWTGGTILKKHDWIWSIFSLTRLSDPDRSSRFRNALTFYGATGGLEDLNDEPGQRPVALSEIRRTVSGLIGDNNDFDLVITHGPQGEYTRHIRHEEVSAAVTEIWLDGKIQANEFWYFAYEDGGGSYLPRPIEGSINYTLPPEIWRKKRKIIEDIYGFSSKSWEAKANQRIESFRKFRDPDQLKKTLLTGGKR